MLKLSRPPRIACATMVYNERYWFPVWLKYYKQIGDIFVLDNDSNDDTFKDVKDITIIPVKSEFSFDHRLLIDKRNEIIDQLLKTYEAVVFTEVDEFVVPLYSGISGVVSWMLRKDIHFIYCTGYEIYQAADDTALDLQKKILSQRRFMSKHCVFSKPAIFTKFYEWGTTHQLKIHYEMQMEEVDNKLGNRTIPLLHTHWSDRDIAIKRHTERIRDKKFNPIDLEVKTGYHNYDSQFLNELLLRGHRLIEDKTITSEIPKQWKLYPPL